MQKIKSILILLSLVLVGIVGCNSNKSYEKNENGLKYIIYTENKGPKIKEGDVVSMIFKMKNSKDSLINSQLDLKKPFALPLRKAPFKGSVEEGLMLLTKGDSATFLVNVDSMFKGGPMPPFIQKGTDIRFDVKILKIQSAEAYQKEQMEAFTKERGNVEKVIKEHVAIDDKLIQDYLTKNNIVAEKTASGLYYKVETPGSGPKPVIGDSVKVSYQGLLLDGTQFDPQQKGEMGNFTFPVGTGAVIPGWDEGILLFNKGTKAKLFIPSGLAYKNEQAGMIKPYSVLIFNIEILDLKKKK